MLCSRIAEHCTIQKSMWHTCASSWQTVSKHPARMPLATAENATDNTQSSHTNSRIFAPVSTFQTLAVQCWPSAERMDLISWSWKIRSKNKPWIIECDPWVKQAQHNLTRHTHQLHKIDTTGLQRCSVFFSEPLVFYNDGRSTTWQNPKKSVR